MAIAPTRTDYDLIQLRTRNVKVKVSVLNFNFQTVSSFEGRLVDGNISIDADNDIRRTCNVTLAIKNVSRVISPGGEIWLDKYIRIYEGIDNPKNNFDTVWYTMGTFLINNPNTVFSPTENSVTFEGLDLMAKLTGRRNGQLPAVATMVPAGSKIANVVKSIITELAGFSSYIIVDNDLEVPYDIKLDMGATIYDLLSELRDLYPNWEMFFDVNGVFHWQPIPTGRTDAVVLDFDQLPQKIITNGNVNVDFENVKNNIIVYGRLLDTGEQIQATATDTLTSSPYNINSIGQINYIVNDERIYSNDLAEQRADYELYLHARLNDSITMEIVPVYWLNDVNVKIKCTDIEKGIEGEYLIKSLQIPLGIDSPMTINAMKVYEEMPTITSGNQILKKGD